MPSSFLFWHPEGALAELHRARVVLLVAREKGAVGDEVKRGASPCTPKPSSAPPKFTIIPFGESESG